MEVREVAKVDEVEDEAEGIRHEVALDDLLIEQEPANNVRVFVDPARCAQVPGVPGPQPVGKQPPSQATL